MKRFILAGHAGFYNRGCEAIVRGTLAIIHDAFPDSQVVLQSGFPEDDLSYARQKGIELDGVLPDELPGAPRWSPAWMWQTFDRRILSHNMGWDEYISMPLYREFDVVMSIGGDNFTEDYRSPEGRFGQLLAARRAGARSVVWGASVGPFRNPRQAKRWAEILRHVDLITVRESIALEYLETLGVSKNVRLVSDPAFLLPPIPPPVDPLADGGDGVLLGMGMSDLIPRFGIDRTDYVAACAGAAQYAISAWNARIIFVSHVVSCRPTRDDLAVCKETAERLSPASRVTVLPGSLSACEIKHCISKCTWFVGARTHSTIASLSMAVPTISIGYSPKALGINRAVLGTDEYVIPSHELTADRLIRALENLSSKAAGIRERLRNAMPGVVSAALQAGAYLKEVLA
jgi:colanic acid/amylovoran biosynthesis protein